MKAILIVFSRSPLMSHFDEEEIIRKIGDFLARDLVSKRHHGVEIEISTITKPELDKGIIIELDSSPNIAIECQKPDIIAKTESCSTKSIETFVKTIELFRSVHAEYLKYAIRSLYWDKLTFVAFVNRRDTIQKANLIDYCKKTARMIRILRYNQIFRDYLKYENDQSISEIIATINKIAKL